MEFLPSRDRWGRKMNREFQHCGMWAVLEGYPGTVANEQELIKQAWTGGHGCSK